ncbi:hypothetical protein SAMN05216323_10132 [Williamwhitmania taraxaci]|uniref:Uncharacterized protein n=1 Tax=Williamwhitmania taraxaci TaxID=1640674 RepID=A0A1G6HSI7_9BACT|nr:hypothetical protein SAMN05216323_10132 [Williamwhitmania taraxaci]
MIRYFSTKFISYNDKKTIIKAMDSLIDRTRDDCFIFPFCLFHKSYYSHFKEKRSKIQLTNATWVN